MTNPVYILGGAQSDFSRNWTREGRTIFNLFSETLQSAFEVTGLDPNDVDVGHVANFEGSLYTGQSHLAGLYGHVDEKLSDLPASRHEAACASGSMAILAAMADIESGRYQVASVVGVEVMRTENSDDIDRLRGAAWVGQEFNEATYVWPRAFSELIEIYENRFNLKRSHLEAISQKNYRNAKVNPNAQTRNWHFNQDAYRLDHPSNPSIEGKIHRMDCGQITDGACAVFLASEEFAKTYAQQHDIPLDSIPKIKGWSHINAPLKLQTKLERASESEFVFPHVNKLACQVLLRAGLNSINQVDGIELHDCFNITEYMILDHLGIERPGEIWKSIEAGKFEQGGSIPVNTSGGLIGLGHPVGATGVRMLLDASKQVGSDEQEMQIHEARNMLTINIGGTTTTCASFIVGR